MTRPISDAEVMQKLEVVLARVVSDPQLKSMKLSRATPLANLAIDSLQMAELVLEFEDAFEMELDDDQLLEMSRALTLGEFVDVCV